MYCRHKYSIQMTEPTVYIEKPEYRKFLMHLMLIRDTETCASVKLDSANPPNEASLPKEPPL